MREFTKKEYEKIERLRLKGWSKRRIGEKMDASIYMIEIALGERERASKPAHKAEPIIDRNCLRCGVAFKAEGRFIRLCQPCKHSHAWRDGAPVGTFAAQVSIGRRP